MLLKEEKVIEVNTVLLLIAFITIVLILNYEFLSVFSEVL